MIPHVSYSGDLTTQHLYLNPKKISIPTYLSVFEPRWQHHENTTYSRSDDLDLTSHVN